MHGHNGDKWCGGIWCEWCWWWGDEWCWWWAEPAEFASLRKTYKYTFSSQLNLSSLWKHVTLRFQSESQTRRRTGSDVTGMTTRAPINMRMRFSENVSWMLECNSMAMPSMREMCECVPMARRAVVSPPTCHYFTTRVRCFRSFPTFWHSFWHSIVQHSCSAQYDATFGSQKLDVQLNVYLEGAVNVQQCVMSVS